MAEGKLESDDFETYVRYTDKAAHAESVRANDRFALAMANAVKRGREKATPGTFVDLTPPIGAVRLRGDATRSACGSPAAMCLE